MAADRAVFGEHVRDRGAAGIEANRRRVAADANSAGRRRGAMTKIVEPRWRLTARFSAAGGRCRMKARGHADECVIILELRRRENRRVTLRAQARGGERADGDGRKHSDCRFQKSVHRSPPIPVERQASTSLYFSAGAIVTLS